MLTVKDLSIRFEDHTEIQEVVRHVSFSVSDGEIVGIVGESGSGKTMTALTIAGLIKRNAIIESGEILLGETNLLALSEAEMRKIQGRHVGMIFQEPMTALNPTMRIGKQVEEALLLHTGQSRQERKENALKALQDVELEHPEQLYRKYPHELSGGMRQRVMIAAAIVCRPCLLIADEPTTALDVKTQESILKLIKKLNQKYNMSVLFISHNLRVINSLCSKVLVMQQGEIIEAGETKQIFENPEKEYTKQLIAAIPTRTKNHPFYEVLKEEAGEVDV